MTLSDILSKAAGVPIGSLIVLLRAGANALPDLRAEAEAIIAKLETAVAPSNLIALAEALPKEIANIARGQIDPRNHPSDAA